MVHRPRALGWCALAAVAALAAPPAARAEVGSLAAADLKVMGEPGQGAGFRVGPAGDLDGDRHADVVVGAWQDGARGPFAGAAYVMYGRRDGQDQRGRATPSCRRGHRRFRGRGLGGRRRSRRRRVRRSRDRRAGPDPAPVNPAPRSGSGVRVLRPSDRLSGTAQPQGCRRETRRRVQRGLHRLSIASRTDVDDDRYDDLVIGAPRDDAGGARPARSICCAAAGTASAARSASRLPTRS